MTDDLLVDDSYVQPTDVDSAKLNSIGLDDETVRQITESVIIEMVGLDSVLRSIAGIKRHMTLGQVRRVINLNPMRLALPIDRMGACIESLVRDAGIESEDAMAILEQEFEILAVEESDFRLKCSFLARVVPDAKARLAFLLAHPGYFHIQYSHLLKKQRERLGECTHKQIWEILTSDGDTTIGLKRLPAYKRKPRVKVAPVTPVPPTEPSPTAPESIVPPESTPQPLAVAETKRSEDEFAELGMDAAEKDVPVRVQFPEVRTSSTPIELTDTNGMYVRDLIKYLKVCIGLCWDSARPLVVYRPWLADPKLNNMRTLEMLYELGVSGERLMDALKYDGLFALGYYALEPMLTELKENRDLPFPDDIRDLAIPRRIIRRRLKALEKNEIAPSDPRFKSALYAPTEREFKERIS